MKKNGLILIIGLIGICALGCAKAETPLDELANVRAGAILSKVEKDVLPKSGVTTLCKAYHPYSEDLDVYYKELGCGFMPYLYVMIREEDVISKLACDMVHSKITKPLNTDVVRKTVEAEGELIKQLQTYRDLLTDYMEHLNKVIIWHQKLQYAMQKQLELNSIQEQMRIVK